MAEPPIDLRRRILVRRLAARHPELELAGDDLHLPLGAALVKITIEARDSARAFARGRTAALGYMVQGDLAGEAKDGARDALLAIGQSLLAIEDSSDEVREVGSFEGLAALPPGTRARPARPLLVDPSALIPTIQRLHEAELNAGASRQLLELPPCLSIEMRPEPLGPEIAPKQAVLLPEPCNACGAAACCPALPASPPAMPLRPLRHAEATAAALAAVSSIAAAFERPVPAAALQFLVEVQALRRGLHSIPPVPFELSLKRSDTRLDATLRIVEYSPRSPPGADSRGVRGPVRRRALVRILERMAGTVASEAAAWLERVERHASVGLEMSIGVEIDLATGGVRPQLYAHVEPESGPRARDLVEAMLAFASAVSPDVRAIAEEPGGSALVLAAHAPTAGTPHRVKLYFARALASGHARSGLVAANPGSLAAYAPDTGLAVLAADGRGAVWEKWDFPCARHFQATQALPEDFARGLDDPDAARIRRILDGDTFAPWYTWLSVGRGSRAVYFVPR
jgi:hypothetical protein